MECLDSCYSSVRFYALFNSFSDKKIHCLINYRFKNFLIRTFEIMQPITEGRPASHAVPDYKYVHGQMAAATCGPLDRIITDY